MARTTLGAFLFFFFWVLFAIDTNAQTGWGVGSWQAVGAVGTPDGPSQAKVVLWDNGWADIKETISSTSVKLRYNIPPLDGLRGDPEYNYTAYRLRVRVRDNGPLARVLVKIKAMDWDEGTVRTLATFDSDAVIGQEPPDQNGVFHFWGADLVDRGQPVKFFRPYQSVYWAEVQLVKNGLGGNPGISALGVLIDM